MRTSCLIGVLLVASLGSAALADTDKPGRYTMAPTDGGFLRLDTVTGSVALCARRDDKWACDAVPDGTNQFRQEIDRLEKENKVLKDDVARLEDSLGLNGSREGVRPPDLAPPRPKMELPSEEDVDKAMDYVQRMFRKFRDKLKEFENKDPSRNPKGEGTPL